MKKFLAILLCAVMILAFAACTPAEDPVVEKDYKLGMGVVVSTAESKISNAQVDATVAAVVTDADGKIVACRIDCAQNKMNITLGAVELDKTFKTKMELGADYNMATYGAALDNNGDGKVLEWDAQAKAFEAHMVGKTVADVRAMTTAPATQGSVGYQISTDADLLAAGCTIQIADMRDAVVKACEDAQGMSFKSADESFTLGVAAKTVVDAETKAAALTQNGSVNMYTDFAATVIADGKIVATVNDAIQPKFEINALGDIVNTTFVDTKRCLKEGYNMATYGAALDNNGDGKVLEWYLQSEAFSKHIVGMTGAEVAAMETAPATQGSVGYMISTDADLLAAGCTMQIGDICAVVAQAATNAR